MRFETKRDAGLSGGWLRDRCEIVRYNGAPGEIGELATKIGKMGVLSDLSEGLQPARVRAEDCPDI